MIHYYQCYPKSHWPVLSVWIRGAVNKATADALSPKKGLMKRKFSPSLLTVMYNKTQMDSTMDRWWCLELLFFFFTPSLKEVWLKKRAQAKNEFYGALDESCRLRGMPSVPKPSSSVCLESRTGRDGDPTFDFKTSIRG
jgi:hypothetical protein